MAKKKSEKEVVTDEASTNKVILFFKNETIHFVLGLVLLFFRCICCWLSRSFHGSCRSKHY